MPDDIGCRRTEKGLAVRSIFTKKLVKKINDSAANRRLNLEALKDQATASLSVESINMVEWDLVCTFLCRHVCRSALQSLSIGSACGLGGDMWNKFVRRSRPLFDGVGLLA